MTPQAIAVIEALTEDLPGIVDNLTDAVADWQDTDLTPAERREQQAEAEATIESAIHDLLRTAEGMRGCMK